MNVHPYDDIEAFAIGGLEAGDAQRLLEHADSCHTCAILLSEAMAVASALEPPSEKPLALPTNVVTRVHSRRRNVASWLAGIAAAAAIIALAFYDYDLRSNGLTVPIALLVHSHFQHHELRGNIGSVKVIQALDGSWLYLVGDDLQPHLTYALVEVVDGKEHQVGLFSANPAGQASAYWQQPPAKIRALIVKRSARQPNNVGELRWP